MVINLNDYCQSVFYYRPFIGLNNMSKQRLKFK